MDEHDQRKRFEARRKQVADKLLYYEVLFSTLLQGWDQGIVIEDLLVEVADVLAWEKGLADLELDSFIDEVKHARELNRRFIQMEIDVDWASRRS